MTWWFSTQQLTIHYHDTPSSLSLWTIQNCACSLAFLVVLRFSYNILTTLWPDSGLPSEALRHFPKRKKSGSNTGQTMSMSQLKWWPREEIGRKWDMGNSSLTDKDAAYRRPSSPYLLWCRAISGVSRHESRLLLTEAHLLLATFDQWYGPSNSLPYEEKLSCWKSRRQLEPISIIR